MATSAVAGYRGKVLASTTSTGAVTAIAEVKNFSLTVEMAEIDATSHESSGHREVIGGTNSWSGSADYLQVMANATHQETYDMLVTKTLSTFEFYPTGSSGDGYYTGTGYFTNWELASPNDDALAVSISLVGSGALTRG